MHRNKDIERALPPQSSSSYGSFDGSSCSHLQHTHPKQLNKLDEGSPSTIQNGGLSMHEHNMQVDDSAAPATSAADDTTSTGDTAHAREHTHPAHTEHLVKSRQYYRDMVLGVNDGLVSTFLLVAGVVGGGMDVSGVLLTAVSGAIAGAISMFAGEYVATKSQNEVMEGEIKVERNHIKEYHAEEMKELSHLLSLIGIPRSQPILCTDANDTSPRSASARAHDGRKLRRRLTRFYAANPDALLQIMVALEFGVIDEEVRSPFVAGATSLVLFFIGALPSTVPFGFVDDPTMGLIIAGLATGIGLFIVGAVKTWATRGNMWLAAIENLLITACGGAIAYGIGVGFQSLVGEDE